MNKLFTYCLLCCLAFSAKAQVLPVRDLHLKREIEKASISSENKSHSSFNSYYFSDYKDLVSTSSQYGKEFTLLGNDTTKRKSNLFIIPAFQFMFGQSLNEVNENLVFFKLGALIDYSYKDKFAVSFMPSFASFKLPNYLVQDIYSPYVLNGEGFTSGLHTNNNTIVPEYKITYRPFEFLSFELANGKNAFGDGFRSFLLSENASNYQYFKLETEFLDIKYSCVWAKLWNVWENFDPLIGGAFISKKRSVFHYLDWSVSKRFNIGLFESIVIKNSNIDFEYLNPIIFFRPVEFNLGSEDNALLGTNMRFSINNKNAIYGQFLLDDIIVGQLFNDIKHSINSDYSGEYGWFANKWGTQIGYKSFDIFKIKNLDFFTEINIARPYLYSHGNVYKNYSHNHQSLAHPLGANFYESVSGISYFGDRIKIDCKLMYAKVGMDTANTHYGQNIFQATMDGNQGYSYQVQSYFNTILQGNKTDIISARVDFSYFVMKNKNVAINAGVLIRNYIPETGDPVSLNYIYIGLKSNLFDKNFVY